MQGKATIMGHPIHPMLIPFPIAFFTGALICDIISHWSDNPIWPQMSVILIGFGVIGTLAAAVFGFVDYLTAPMSPEAKTTATWHLLLNVVLLFVFAGAYIVRQPNPTSSLGYVLTVAGVILLMGSGMLGGHLAYHYRVGVEEDH
jgi:uncharacterized membrane protein